MFSHSRYFMFAQTNKNQRDKITCHRLWSSMKNIRAKHKELHNRLMVLRDENEELNKKAQEEVTYYKALEHYNKMDANNDEMSTIRDEQKTLFNEHKNLQQKFSGYGCDAYEAGFEFIHNYLKDIDDINMHGYDPISALNKIMDEFDKKLPGYDKKLSELDDFEYDMLTDKINELVSDFGRVTEDIHLFRNKLNRAPATLNEMFKINKMLPPEKRWRLCSPFKSMCHMFGDGGEFNVKFVSADGKFEAVYDINNVLLTNKNSPQNMSSYNFADLSDKIDHFLFDMRPPIKWGNLGHDDPLELIKALKNYSRFKNSPSARKHYYDIYFDYNYLNY